MALHQKLVVLRDVYGQVRRERQFEKLINISFQNLFQSFLHLTLIALAFVVT